MGLPAAKENDKIVAVDIHIVMVPNVSGETPVPLPHPFSGKINGELSDDVKIMGKAAATVGSTAKNDPQHTATPPGTRFQNQPQNKGTIKKGSQTVKINGKAAARAGDQAETCNDPKDLMAGTVVAAGTVLIG